MITTDHISPAGSFKDTTPAGQYLIERQVPVREFNSYGARRGNHEYPPFQPCWYGCGSV